MREYLMSVVAVSLLSALAMFISYGSVSQRAVRAAVSMILIYSVSMPIIGFVADFDAEDISFSLDYTDYSGEAEYLKVAQSAFCDGIAELVAEKFDIKKEDIKVTACGFDFESVRAETIKITLCGRAALADARSVAALVSDSGLGYCEVNIGFEAD